MTSPGRLQIIAPGEEPWTVILDKPVLRIGRLAAPENDLTLMHSLVSRRHAQIFCDREPYRIVDLGSSNGTQVNDIPLPANEVRELHDGDRITIGPFTLMFQAPQPASAEQPAPPRPTTRSAVTRPPAPKAVEEPFADLRVEEAPPAAPPPEVPPPLQRPTAPPPDGTAFEPWVDPAQPSRWLQYLPYYFSEDPFLGRYLLIFEDLFGPLEQMIAHWDLFLDPRTAPESFLPTLAAWLGLELDERWPAEQRRAILRAAVELYDWRGTKKGLTRLLEASTGCRVEIVENSDGPHTFLVTLIPSAQQKVDEHMLRYLIEANKPAHTVYRLEIAQA